MSDAVSRLCNLPLPFTYTYCTHPLAFATLTRHCRSFTRVMPVEAASHSHAISIIVASCVAWKILLLGIAAASPGPGYDTSTQLLLGRHEAFDHPAAWIAHLVATKLTRWDAFYYVSTAARGYALFEQEWAFGWGMKELIHRVTACR